MPLLYPHKEPKDLTVSGLIFSWESRILPDLFISPSEKGGNAESSFASVDSAQYYATEIQLEKVKSKFASTSAV